MHPPQQLLETHTVFDAISKICSKTRAPDYDMAICGVPPAGCEVSNLQKASASLLTRQRSRLPSCLGKH